MMVPTVSSMSCSSAADTLPAIPCQPQPPSSSQQPPQRPPPPPRDHSDSSITLNKGTSKEVQRQKPTFISCTHCRARKVKCSGDKPMCTNCLKRGLNCHYDAFVKRRGPDKEPGGRLRARGTFVNYSAAPSRASGTNGAARVPSAPGGQLTPTWRQPIPPHASHQRVVSTPYPTALNPSPPRNGLQNPAAMRLEASSTQQIEAVQAVHRDGWAALLKDYTLPQLTNLCRIFFVQLDLWFNFFHQGLFFRNLIAQRTPPHVLCAVLAHTTLFTEGETKRGQLRALHFAHEARRQIDACLTAGARDIALVQTSVLLAAFEFQPHLQQNLSRAIAAWSFVESCATRCIPETLTAPPNADGAVSGTTAAIEAAELRRLDWTFSQLSASLTIWDCLLDKAHGQALPSPSRPTLFVGRDAGAAPKTKSWHLYQQSITLWHQAVRSPQGPTHPQMVDYARSLLREAQSTPDTGTRNYAWQATDWTKVALGMLGDLNDADIALWMSDQKKALMNVSYPTDPQEKQQLQSFCWWYLMVAYTTIRLTSNSPANRHSAESVLAEVDKALHSISARWSCSALEHQCSIIKQWQARLHDMI